MEKKFLITVACRNAEDYIEDCNCYYDKEEAQEFIDDFKDVVKNYEISSLEEYFDILDRVTNLTDGEYSVYNKGRLIMVFE